MGDGVYTLVAPAPLSQVMLVAQAVIWARVIHWLVLTVHWSLCVTLSSITVPAGRPPAGISRVTVQVITAVEPSSEIIALSMDLLTLPLPGIVTFASSGMGSFPSGVKNAVFWIVWSLQLLGLLVV